MLVFTTDCRRSLFKLKQTTLRDSSARLVALEAQVAEVVEVDMEAEELLHIQEEVLHIREDQQDQEDILEVNHTALNQPNRLNQS